MGLDRYPRIIGRSFIDFFRDGGLMLAGSMSFFYMMAIVPFCIFFVTVFGYFLGEHDEIFRFFAAKLMSYFPDITSKITQELKKLITYRVIGPYSFGLYALLSYQLFSSMESAINVIFKTKTKRHFIVSIILSVLFMTLIIVFIILSFAATSVVNMLMDLPEYFPGFQIGAVTAFLIAFVGPLALSLLTLTTIYLLLPKKRVRLVHAFAGSLFTAIFLEAAKYLFTIYVVRVMRLGTIYGPLSAFVMFLLWLFYSSCIFLIGAEIVHNLDMPTEKQVKPAAKRRS